MKIKNTIFDQNGRFIPALNNLLGEVIPVREAYELRKFQKEVVEKQTVFEESRLAMAKDFSKKDKDGKPAMEDGHFVLKDVKGFGKSYNELVEIEESYKIKKITLPENIALSVKDLMALEPILNIPD